MEQATRRRSPNTPPLPCQHPGCDRDREARGWCAMHYNRWRAGRDMDAPVKTYKKHPAAPCKITGCEDAATAKGWCNRHYQRWWRIGDPGDADIPRYGLIQVCSAEGCDLPHRTKGYCDRHYRRWKRGVRPDSLKFRAQPKPPNLLSYAAAHRQIVAQRGPASDHLCECGSPARQWAYQHNDPAPLVSPAGHRYSFSFNECYAPMCQTCHNLLDRDPDEQARRAKL